MTEDFTTRLRHELREAAQGEEQRGGFAHAATAVRPRPSLALGSLAAAVAVGLVLLAGLWMASSTDTETATPVVGPRVVANVQVADALGRTAWVGFGSVWMSDANRGDVLRVDPRTRRVTARIPVGAEVSVAVSDGSVWAIPRQGGVAATPLMRIDPRTNTIVARIPMRSPGGREPFNGGVILPGPRLWVLGGTGMLAVDTTRNRPVREVVLGGAFQAIDAHIRGDELWVTRGDRSITRFDAITGRRLGRVRWRAPNGFVFPYADKLVKVARRSVSLVDPRTGRPLWRTRIGTELNQADAVGGRIFVEGVNGATARDSLWELDARTGRVVGTLTVPGFSILNLVAVGREVWMPTAGGRLIVAAP
jgi:hypothetical protein